MLPTVAWTLLPFAATAVAWGIAVTLFVAGKGSAARRLAFLLLLDGAAVVTSDTALLRWVESARIATSIALLHAAIDYAILALYLPFVANALNVGWLKPFRTRLGRRAVGAVGMVGIASVMVFPEHYITSPTRLEPPTYLSWAFEWSPLWALVALGLVAVFTLAVVASVQAWHGAETELLRRRAKAFMWAFGTRDAVWAGVYLTYAILGARLSVYAVAALLQIYAASLLVYAVLIGYGILTTQLLEIDLKLRWTLQKGTVAAAFVAVFFLVSETATTVLSDQLGKALGLLASALLVFALTPLHQFADRLANRTMPHVTPGAEYTSYRKLQIYAAAFEAACQEGGVSARERMILTRLGESLALHPSDIAQLEDDMAAKMSPQLVAGR